jgi:hypothetical protein
VPGIAVSVGVGSTLIVGVGSLKGVTIAVSVGGGGEVGVGSIVSVGGGNQGVGTFVSVGGGLGVSVQLGLSLSANTIEKLKATRASDISSP